MVTPTDSLVADNAGGLDPDTGVAGDWVWVLVILLLLAVVVGGVVYWRRSRDRALNNLFKGGPGSSSTRRGSVADQGPAVENAV